jgi:hypothetical protein
LEEVKIKRMKEDYFDTGLWIIESGDMLVHSDFTHDIGLEVSGDFSSDEEKDMAVKLLCKKLNETIKASYKYRGLPCNIVPDDQLWAVSGCDGCGGGVLEWCMDEKDALRMLSKMEPFPQFKNLKAHKYKEG